MKTGVSVAAKEKKRKKQWKIVAKMRHKREARRSEFLSSHRTCRTPYGDASGEYHGRDLAAPEFAVDSAGGDGV